MKAKNIVHLFDFQIFRLSNWEGRDCGSPVQYCVPWRGRGFGRQSGAIGTTDQIKPLDSRIVRYFPLFPIFVSRQERKGKLGQR